MSIELTQLYKNLSQRQKDELAEEFKNSPKMLSLLDLLQKQNFLNTKKAIDIIYELEIQENISREVLSNRFYKLWEKLKTVILDNAKKAPIFICEEEKQLNYVRFLISKKQFAQALEFLPALEKTCWEKNYFEFLPNIYENFMNAVVGIEPVNKSQLSKYFELKKKAIELKNVLDKIDVYHYQLYLEVSNYEQIIKKIKTLIKDYSYPRFEFLYHYLVLGFGVFLGLKSDRKLQVIPKYFQAFHQIRTQYPSIPLFKLNNRAQLETKITCLEIIHWYFKQNKSRVAKLLTNFAKQSDLIYFLGESSIQNMVIISIHNHNFAEAQQFISLLKTFQEAQYDNDSNMPFYAYELLLYIRQYPKQQPPNPQELIQTWLEKFDKNPNLDTWSYADLANLAILYGEYSIAQICLQKPNTLTYLASLNIPFSAFELLEATQKKDKNALLGFQKKLQYTLKTSIFERAVLEYCKDLAEITRIVLERI